MNLGPEDALKLKESFTLAVRQGEVAKVCSIVETLNQQQITLTFMEQMVLLGKLSKLDAKVGSRILNCGAFRQELVFVGMTCLQDFESKDPTPITVPLVEKELIKAVNEKRFEDVNLILLTARWCISAVLSKWATNKAYDVANSYDDLLAVEYMSKMFLPSQDMHARAVPRIIANSTSNAMDGVKPSRRLTF